MRKSSILRVLGSLLPIFLLAAPALARQAGWHKVMRLTPDDMPGQQSAIFAEGEDVHIVFRLRDFPRSGIYYLRSRDEGKTWTRPDKRISSTRSGEEGSRVTNHPSILVNRDGIHVAWVGPETQADFHHVYYTRSVDDGLTWSEPRMIVGTEETTCFLPKLVRVPEGVGIVFCQQDVRTARVKRELTPRDLDRYHENPMDALWKQEYIDITRTTIKLIRSFDGGETWRPAITIDSAQRDIRNLAVFQRSPSDFSVLWDTGFETTCKRTTSGGDPRTWTNDLESIRRMPGGLTNFTGVIAEGKYVFALTERRAEVAFPKLPVFLEREGANRIVISESDQVVRSTPAIAASQDELHVTWASQVDDKIWINYIRTDRQPPTSRVIDPLSPDIITPVFAVEWDGEDDMSAELEFRWRIAGTSWSDWGTTTRVELEASQDGDYVFEVEARDHALNVQSEPTRFAFNTYKVAPETRWLAIVPSTVYSRFLKASWTGMDNATPVDRLEYQVRRDGGEWSDFTTKTEMVFADLTEGRHTLEVRARDEVGNVDSTPATAIFNVVIGIEVAFSGSPSDYLGTNEVALQWAATDKTSDNFDFFFSSRLDNNLWLPWSSDRERVFGDLSEGRHEVRVKARDAINNTSRNEAAFPFIVDLTPPETWLNYDSTTELNHPIVRFSGEDNFTDAADLRYSYRIDEGPWSDWTPETRIEIPRPIKKLSWGYKIYGRAMDRAGHIDPTPSRVNRLLYARSPMLVAIPIVAVAGIVVLILLAFIGRLFGGRRRSQPEPAPTEDLMGSASDDLFGDSSAPAAGPEGDDDDLFGDSGFGGPGSGDSGSGDSTDRPPRKKPEDDDDDLFG